MTRQIKIFLAGVLVVVPLAITIYVVSITGAWVDDLGISIVKRISQRVPVFPGLGILFLLITIYLVGLLTHFWLFRKTFEWIDKLLCMIPGVEIVYGSIRDLIKLFGSSSQSGGRVVQFESPGSNYSILGIVTNENPAGNAGDEESKVAVYLPLAYNIGGPLIYVSRKHLRELDMSVERALRIVTTGDIGSDKPDSA